MFKILFSALLALSVLPSIADAQITFDVYIIAGQSNTDGRGAVRDLSAAQLANVQNDAIITYLNPGSERERAVPTSNPNDLDVGTNGFRYLVPGGFSVARTNSRELSDTFGPELSFGASIAEATGTNNQIAIIKVSRGGTNLRNDWRVNSTVDSGPDGPEGFLYRALLEEVNDRLADLRADGSTANIKGFVWHQGESDSGSNQYVERYIEFVESVRDEFGENIPFVVGEISRDVDDYANFNANLNQLVADSANNISGVPSNIFLVSSLGLETPSNDPIHFSANGQLELGQRFALSFGNAFVPDPSKVYHIDNPAHGLRLAARSGSEVLESAALSSTGPNTQWRFVQSATSGLWHIQRAAGGNTPRIRTVLSTTPDMQATSSSGDWTRFSIEANASRPGTYLLTVPLANTVNQRLRLLANGTTDFSTNNNVGNNPSFVFTEVN